MNTTLTYILQDKGHKFIKRYGGKMSIYLITVLQSVMNCCSDRNGYRSFFCVECKHVKRIPFTCKKRLCPKCSQWANRRFAINFVQRMLPVTHRHLTMSIPDRLWGIFHSNRKLKKLFIDNLILSNNPISYHQFISFNVFLLHKLYSKPLLLYEYSF